MSTASSHLNLVVMGVSGCGKSSVGEAVAKRLGGEFFDGDDLHPPSNIERMTQGIPLTDEDRMPWLASINQRLQSSPGLQPEVPVNVVACSALKRSYRDVLSHKIAVVFVHLQGDFALIEARSKEREGHFMNLTLLQSQFDALEPIDPSESAVVVSIESELDVVVDEAVTKIRQHPLYISLAKG